MTFIRKLQFFEIDPEGFNFGRFVNRVFQRNLTKIEEGGRIMSLGNDSVAITELDSDDNYIEGMIVRVQKEDIPYKGSLLRNAFEQIHLLRDEGIADMTYFCYVRSIGVLCLLPAKNGVKWGTFTSYFQEFLDDEEFDLLPLINPDTRSVLNSWNSITYIQSEIKIGNNSRTNSGQTQQLPLGIAMDEARRYNPARLKLELFNYKRKGGLIASTVKQLSRALQRLSGDCEVEHINIKGSPDAETNDSIIDLIEQKFELTVTLGSGGRFLDYTEARTNVQEKIEANINQIRGMIE